MKIVLRGVRGGAPNPAPEMSRYGGNTACIEVRPKNGPLIFLDAGTGLREAGKGLPESGEAHVFITHGHADHIIGLWFFKPLHSPAWTTHLYLPEHLETLPDYFFQSGLFPLPLAQLKGRIVQRSVKAGEDVSLARANGGPVLIEAFPVCHPGGGLGYRVQADGAALVYTGDHEITGDDGIRVAAKMLRGADVAVVDAQYERADLRPGFGHSAWEDWAEAAALAGSRRLILVHHDPDRSDMDLDARDKRLEASRGSTVISLGREGMRFSVERPFRRTSDRIFLFLEKLTVFRDAGTALDCILAEARKITSADAGTIFLAEGGELVFAYTHNDSLFSTDDAHKHAYSSIRLPISKQSIVGYAAFTGQTLNLADVRVLPADAPYRFNDSFDRQTGFTTHSVLALPFLNNQGKTLGVLMLVNSLAPDKTPRAFSPDMERDCRMLAREVSGILERNAVERSGIYNILRMAAVHDPSETGPHAERVGAVAAELYHAWAKRRGHGPDAIRHEKDRLRLAAMLHDIGKVGVSDLILKKPGKLTDEEFTVMRGHTALGASILAQDTGEIAALARDIALHHHQKWNGRGYAGASDEGKLAGIAIPLAARVTAIADVFDALVSPRCYKEPWSFEAALDFVRGEAGAHFDPALVESMADIGDLLRPIYERFPDERRGGETGGRVPG